MPVHVFVDESKAKGLLMAATMCPAAEVNAHRRMMAGLLMPRERRIHFTKESPARRRCLAALVRDIAGSAERLVIERDESTVTVDKQVLFHAAREYECAESLQYELLAAHADPLLWIPDAVAWSWVKGEEWRDLVAPYSTVISV